MDNFSKELRSDKYQRILSTPIHDLSPQELQQMKSDIEGLLPTLQETDIATSSRGITSQWFILKQTQLVKKLSAVEKKLKLLKNNK